jgi:hypothetical protein
MTQFSTFPQPVQNSGATSAGEIGAFVIAIVIKIAVVYAITYLQVLTAAYRWAFQSGHTIGVYVVSVGMSIVYAAVILLLFLAVRAAFGAVPARLGAPSNAFTSSASEIGAFVIAAVLMIIALLILNTLFLGQFYVSLSRSGQQTLALGIGVALQIVQAAILYLIFIGLRQAFVPAGMTRQ